MAGEEGSQAPTPASAPPAAYQNVQQVPSPSPGDIAAYLARLTVSVHSRFVGPDCSLVPLHMVPSIAQGWTTLYGVLSFSCTALLPPWPSLIEIQPV